MTSSTIPAIERLDRTARAVFLTVGVRTLLWFLSSLTLGVAVLSLADLLVPMPIAARVVALPLAMVVAAAVARRAWREGRGVRSRLQLALWIEGLVPSLRFALATLADPRLPAGPWRAELERAVAQSSWGDQVQRATTRALTRPMGLLLLAFVSLALLPSAAVTRVTRPRPGDILNAASPRRSRGSILAPLVGTVTPPAYAHRAATSTEEPVSLAGISGSDVLVEGRGDASRIHARLGDSAVGSSSSAGKWQVRFRMPAAPLALRLGDGVAERLVTIEPFPDSVPVVTLKTPVHDTVVRAPEGTIALAADATDDIGLDSLRFEYIVTSGEMESFTFRTGVAQRAAAGGARTGDLRGSLPLGSLGLKPGDIVHVRAVATDQNSVTGPGRGASETRTIRIARQGEYDSVDVEALPPTMGDTAALSERMLIMLAEALERRRPHLARDTVVHESHEIGIDQARLRRKVADVVFMRLTGESSAEEAEGGDTTRGRTPEQVLAAAESSANRDANAATDFATDESPVVAVNRPLLEAYNAMWDAGRFLEIGEPGDALPHMRLALAAIQRARLAERIYLRGRPPTQVVDTREARLKGDRAGAGPSLRLPASSLGAERARLAERLAGAAAVARASPADAADSLLLLRLAALGKYPAFAEAAARAARALRAGRDATAELLRARDGLLGAPRHDARLPAWSVAP